MLTPDKCEEILDAALRRIGKLEVDWEVCSSAKVFGDLIHEALALVAPGREITRMRDLAIKIEATPSEEGRIVFLERQKNTLSGQSLERNRKRLVSILVEVTALLDKEPLATRSALGSIDLKKIVPLLKTADMLETMVDTSDIPDAEPTRMIWWPVTGNVVGVPALDAPDKFLFVSERIAEMAKKEPAAFVEAAMHNLRVRYKRWKYKTDYDRGPQRVAKFGGFASSLIMLTDFLEKERSKAGDDLVIHLVHYDCMLILRKSDTAALAATLLETRVLRSVPSVFDESTFVYDSAGLRLISPADVKPRVH